MKGKKDNEGEEKVNDERWKRKIIWKSIERIEERNWIVIGVMDFMMVGRKGNIRRREEKEKERKESEDENEKKRNLKESIEREKVKKNKIEEINEKEKRIGVLEEIIENKDGRRERNNRIRDEG